MTNAVGDLAALLREVRRIEAESAELVASLHAGAWASRFRGAGIEFDEVREYVPGDDPRSVDWNVTARHGRLCVKRYVDERERALGFVLDRSASMGVAPIGGSGLAPRAAAARVIAALALAASGDHDRVALFSGAARVDHVVRPATGPLAALRLVRDALALPSSPGRADLAALLDAATRALPSGSIILLLSDFHSTGWRTAALRCAARHDLVGVRLASDQLPPATAGVLDWCEPESGTIRRVDLGDPRVRLLLTARSDALREATRLDLRRAGGEMLDLAPGRGADPAGVRRGLARFFLGRALRRASA